MNRENLVPNTMLTLLNTAQAAEHYRAGHWREETIYRLVHEHAAGTPEKTAIRESNREIDYAGLVDAADRLAGSLHRSGVLPGQRVACWLPSRIETAVALLACSRNGYVCCPSLHRDHTVAEVLELLRRMRATAFLGQPGYGADAGRRDVFAELSGLRASIRLAPVTAPGPVLADLPAAGETRPPDDPDRVVYLAFTSGTTGEPKGVMHSDNTVLAPGRALAADWSIDRSSVVYTLSPLSHNLGFGAMAMTLIRGGELVLHDLPRGASLVDRLDRTGATFVIGVPTHAIDLLAEMRQRGHKRLGEVRGFRVSGAPVPAALARGLLEHGVIPQSGYGMTEAGSHNYTLPGDDTELVTGTSGRSCAGYQTAIFATDDLDRQLPPGEVGHIGGRGACLMLGYFADQTATESAFNAHGWFMTGDLGWMDEAGYLRVTGRGKEVIIRGGHNILPTKIENLALQHNAVDKAAVIGVPDDRLGERVCLVVTLRPGNSLPSKEILAHLDESGLSRYDMPEYLVRLDSMPLSPSGKILKRRLVEWVDAGRLHPEPVRFAAS